MFRFVVACVLPLPALAGEVLWFDEPTPAERIAVDAAASPTGLDLTLEDLATADTRFQASDQEALDALAAAIEEVRPYETRLDGELVIMRDLTRPIEAVTVLRNASDRDVVFKALTYQGFAVDRYFMQGLATDDQAEDYRLQVEGVVVERPWADAIALDPERTLTAYDIAEAPQRVAYAQVQEELARALPASIVPEGLGEDATLVVDGTPRDVGPTGGVRVPLGRHWVHVEQNGVITQRWTLRLAAGEQVVASVVDPLQVTRDWVDAVWSDPTEPMPDSVRRAVQALGGDVWLARPGGRTVEVLRLTGDGVTRTEVTAAVARREATSGFSVAVGVHGGWLSTGNFALDKPGADFSRSEVNALNLGAGLGMAWTRGLFRVGAGLQAAYTPGADHVARYSGGQTHMRLYPHVAVGLTALQVTLGYAFPMHPTAGLRSEIALAGGLELQASVWLGVGGERERDTIEPYSLKPLYAATLGVGWRFGL